MVGHEVENDLETPAVCFGHKPIKIVESAEHWLDACVIGHVIPKVGHGRFVDGRYPEGVNAQPLQVVEPARDPVEIAYAVAIGVHEATRVNLVDDARLP